MKKWLSRSVSLFFPLVALSFFSLSVHAAETYTFDSHHTAVVWHINHFGFSNPSGKWMVNGTLVLDEAKPQNSKVNVTIHVADISTGLKDLDEHLQGPLFFDTKKFPSATFVSNKITITGKDTAKVAGILTIRDIAKPIVLDVKLNKLDINPISNKKTAGFSAHAQLARADFGITTLAPGLGDQVSIDIEAEANLVN